MNEIKVLEFFRKVESGNPFTPVLKDPTFCILIVKNNKTRELILNLKGDYPYMEYPTYHDYEENAYKDYRIIKGFLLGDNKELLRDRWGLTEKEYYRLVFEMKKVLINNHSFFGDFKKKLLILLEFLKFQTGRIGK